MNKLVFLCLFLHSELNTMVWCCLRRKRKVTVHNHVKKGQIYAGKKQCKTQESVSVAISENNGTPTLTITQKPTKGSVLSRSTTLEIPHNTEYIKVESGDTNDDILVELFDNEFYSIQKQSLGGSGHH